MSLCYSLFLRFSMIFVALMARSQSWSMTGKRTASKVMGLYTSRLFANLVGYPLQEYVITPKSYDEHTKAAIDHLQSLRPGVQVHVGSGGQTMWTSVRGGLQVDATLLEPRYLGKHQLSEIETARAWDQQLTERNDMLSRIPRMGVSGKLQIELDRALAIVQRMSFISRAFQHSSIHNMNVGSMSKVDTTPVTIADFAVQAVVLDFLEASCPQDRFIAEEDSQLLRQDQEMCDKVIHLVQAATGEIWTKERLYHALDLGQFKGGTGRVWVLDPVDGTKGFIRGEHYCIALGLLIDGRPQLSVLGCPNLNVYKVLQRSPEEKIAVIEPWQQIEDLEMADVSSGSIYFAVSGEGSFARALDMQLGAASEIFVSGIDKPIQSVLCESVEATFGNRDVTKQVAASIGLQKQYLRLDGQCKGCVVGSGAAEATLRLPPKGYVEKIWDHLPGCHFIQEAGGTVTDLKGRPLDFSLGRELSPDVTGVVASNGRIHAVLLEEIDKAKQVYS